MLQLPVCRMLSLATYHCSPIYSTHNILKGGGTYIHTYIHTYIRTYIHTYIHTYVHTYIHIHIYVHTHIHTHINTYTYTYTLTHTHTQTYIHTYIHTYTYIHAYNSLVPRPRPDFRHLQYGKAGRAWYLFSREHDVISKLRKFAELTGCVSRIFN